MFNYIVYPTYIKYPLIIHPVPNLIPPVPCVGFVTLIAC